VAFNQSREEGEHRHDKSNEREEVVVHTSVQALECAVNELRWRQQKFSWAIAMVFVLVDFIAGIIKCGLLQNALFDGPGKVVIDLCNHAVCDEVRDDVLIRPLLVDVKQVDELCEHGPAHLHQSNSNNLPFIVVVYVLCIDYIVHKVDALLDLPFKLDVHEDYADEFKDHAEVEHKRSQLCLLLDVLLVITEYMKIGER